ncbi:hypothetical protein [Amphritea balenae]|nr:hypothetical protein [Amphritea balenae]GGK55472.1 hypothetical protein GCM10007941_01950 [Amphritea balenae]
MKTVVVLAPDSCETVADLTDSVFRRVSEQDLEVVNEALQQKHSGSVNEVIVVAIGQPLCSDDLNRLFRLGVDRSRHTPCDLIPSNMELAETLVEVIRNESPDLILIGRRSNGQQCLLGKMLAELLDFRSSQAVSSESQLYRVLVIREIGSGMQTVEMPLMALPGGSSTRPVITGLDPQSEPVVLQKTACFG